MSYQKILVGEISLEIDKLMELKRIIEPKSIADLVCGNHIDELNGDAPFSTYNNYTNVRSEVRKVLSKKMESNIDSANEGQQLVIVGFECLQKYYSIKRDGVQLGVPIEEMDISEGRKKAKDYRKMGNTCFIHADELDKYFDNKKGSKTA